MTKNEIVSHETGTQIEIKQNGADWSSFITQALSQPELSADVLHKLISAQERVMDRQSEIDFNQDMAKLRRDLNDHPVMKSRNNNQTKSKYADLEDVKRVVDPLLAKYGFFDRYEDDFPADGTIGTTCEIVHMNGHSKKNRVQFKLDDRGIAGSVNKTQVHAAASSMTYGQRVSLCRALGVRISEDDDGNAAGSQTINDDQLVQIEEWIESSGADKDGFLKYMGVRSISQIPASSFNKAVWALKSKQKQSESK